MTLFVFFHLQAIYLHRIAADNAVIETDDISFKRRPAEGDKPIAGVVSCEFAAIADILLAVKLW